MKRCTKCKRELPETDFNKNKREKSGLRAECRECQHIEYARYAKTPAAKERKVVWANSAFGRLISRKSDRDRNQSENRRDYKREKVAERRKNESTKVKERARNAVNNAIKQGKMVRGTRCEFAYTGECAGKIMAHHDDYNKPLDIRWLCSKHDYDTHHGRMDN